MHTTPRRVPICLQAVGAVRCRAAVSAVSPVARLFAMAALFVVVQASAAQALTPTDAQYPNVLSATVRSAGANTFDFDVTISSRYDTPQRYADGFRVTRTTGEVLGERTLWHDHQGEQPFTRDLYGVRIPVGIRVVRIQGRDKQHGYGGQAIDVRLPGRP